MMQKSDSNTNALPIKFEINDYQQNLRYKKDDTDIVNIGGVPFTPDMKNISPKKRQFGHAGTDHENNDKKRDFQNLSKAICDLNIGDNEYNLRNKNTDNIGESSSLP